MQRTAVSVEQLADDLMRFFVHHMSGEDNDFLELIAELDLTIPQLRAIFVIGKSERALALTEVAPRMGLSVAAAGRAVDRLVRDGLLTRAEDPADRRIKRLALTDRGRTVTERINGARTADLRQLAARLDERERGDLAAALAPLLDRLTGRQGA
jgi:DNA-binding MarR family transcriptional regulator